MTSLHFVRPELGSHADRGRAELLRIERLERETSGANALGLLSCSP